MFVDRHGECDPTTLLDVSPGIVAVAHRTIVNRWCWKSVSSRETSRDGQYLNDHLISEIKPSLNNELTEEISVSEGKRCDDTVH
jgi:hypothetical protein